MSTDHFELFLEALGKPAARNRAVAHAVTLIRTLIQPGGPWRALDLLTTEDPGAPDKVHFVHAMPVFHVPRGLDLHDPEALLKPIKRFNRVIVMIGGENDLFLTTVTLRKENHSEDWEVIRVGRSHFAAAFERLNALLLGNETMRVNGCDIQPAKHLAMLPAATLRMPDRLQYFLVMEVMGTPCQTVPFLFFPVYDPAGDGYAPLTLETLQDRTS